MYFFPFYWFSPACAARGCEDLIVGDGLFKTTYVHCWMVSRQEFQEADG